MSTKKRRWPENFVLYGFTCATESNETQLSQCILCNVKMSNSRLSPAKLREHFGKDFVAGKYADTTFDQLMRKRARFHANETITSCGFVPVDKTDFHSVI